MEHTIQTTSDILLTFKQLQPFLTRTEVNKHIAARMSPETTWIQGQQLNTRHRGSEGTRFDPNRRH
jgi:hypothetical protein